MSNTTDTDESVQTTIIDEEHSAPTFAELGVHDDIVAALIADGKTHTFAIQELTLPLALAGDDLIGQARTGMGKTFGFGVPLLHRLLTAPTSGVRELDNTPRALVIVPTRELCLQVTGDLAVAGKGVDVTLTDGTTRPLKVTSIYGGRPYESQIAELQAGVDVVVGTPGRLLDLAQQGHLVLGKVEILVLDEADEMLDLGFLPDIERILAAVPSARQTMLFSATMPGPIVTLARTFLNRPTHIRAEHANDSAVHERTTQHVYRAHALDKAELVARVLQADGRGATMIFTRTKRTAQKVADDLAERGFAVGAVHGDLGQVAREKALSAFREGKIDVLVATDVAARGIDIDDVTHVINYQCPEDDKTYVHRIGRTGRAGRTGIAITLVDWDEMHRWELINNALGLGVPDPVETYSSSEHLREELGIPESATGRIGAPKTASGTRAGREKQTRVERPERTKTQRSRRRTRGGKPAGAGSPKSDEKTPAAKSASAPTAEASTGEDGAPRRRRRRRGGRGKGTGDAVSTAAAAPTAAQGD
ncbi:putative ATP-dependent RNA helicase [Gordonia araii NBRC 100433]|uniref:Putative ATP-dependent RNA helicase n=1 Tax=Gordonia araii NBRC 100433 TaxID=1073574 RepID=G7H2D0_9ACTN|nr:DEAD/DEAH box helicase [Gordonia araii]NNG97544.1 DEAD/DEAH box helicase [Gordonia araii NBRC 100433]GAB10005.1 putative ATP-dependent RNA helicase [Gordonia araii NBRC 100433]